MLEVERHAGEGDRRARHQLVIHPRPHPITKDPNRSAEVTDGQRDVERLDFAAARSFGCAEQQQVTAFTIEERIGLHRAGRPRPRCGHDVPGLLPAGAARGADFERCAKDRGRRHAVSSDRFAVEKSRKWRRVVEPHRTSPRRECIRTSCELKRNLSRCFSAGRR
jgi:hypothetical protein